VPFITQPPVKPGESYTYEFTVPNAGSHMYHSHHNAAIQVGLGLLGAFVVEPRRPHRAPGRSTATSFRTRSRSTECSGW
jgi:FtsP/CotA-like multicopper oxidase with cupredoxin domain